MHYLDLFYSIVFYSVLFYSEVLNRQCMIVWFWWSNILPHGRLSCSVVSCIDRVVKRIFLAPNDQRLKYLSKSYVTFPVDFVLSLWVLDNLQVCTRP